MANGNNGKNDENGFVIFVIAFVGAAMLYLAAFIFALLTLLSFVMTIWCFTAWNKPRTILGDTVTPTQARLFVGSGVIGAFALPAFLLFCEVVFGFRINGDYLGLIITAGYVFGSLGMGMLIAQHEEQEAAKTGKTINSTDYQEVSSKPQGLPNPEAKPFHFADWDDGERR